MASEVVYRLKTSRRINAKCPMRFDRYDLVDRNLDLDIETPCLLCVEPTTLANCAVILPACYKTTLSGVSNEQLGSGCGSFNGTFTLVNNQSFNTGGFCGGLPDCVYTSTQLNSGCNGGPPDFTGEPLLVLCVYFSLSHLSFQVRFSACNHAETEYIDSVDREGVDFLRDSIVLQGFDHPLDFCEYPDELVLEPILLCA